MIQKSLFNSSISVFKSLFSNYCITNLTINGNTQLNENIFRKA